jgi:hypothetical protein
MRLLAEETQRPWYRVLQAWFIVGFVLATDSAAFAIY